MAMVNDVSHAFFYAPATRLVYVELPPEDRTEGEDMVGRLNMSLYGTRDASLNWQLEVSRHLEALGFERGGTAYPCVYTHQARRNAALAHGDEYVSSGGGGGRGHPLVEGEVGEQVRSENEGGGQW